MATRAQSLMEQFADLLHPHSEKISDAIVRAGQKLESRISDLGRPDTGDKFKSIIINGKKPATKESLGGPEQGEVWLIQCLITNGIVNKSPTYVLRTNTGRLLFAVIKEGVGQEPIDGDIILFVGETIEFEPAAEGVFDFTLHVVLRKGRRPQPSAGYSIAQGDDLSMRSPSNEHEPDRYIPDLPGGEAWTGVDVPETVIGRQQEQYGGHDVALPEDPGDLIPET